MNTMTVQNDSNETTPAVSRETASELNQQALGLLFEIAATGDLISLAAGSEVGYADEMPSGTLLEAGCMIKEKANKVVELVEQLHGLTLPREASPETGAQVIEHLDGAVPHPAEVPEGGNDVASQDGFSIPELLGARRADQDGWVHRVLMAALDHARHLRKAEGKVADAMALAETVRSALLSDEYDEQEAPAVVRLIVKMLSQAQAEIDRHSRRHDNLFLAYFERQRPAGGEGGAR
jgi:hypothetical protein